MSYEIHVTRRINWFDKTGANIDLETWQQVVAEDSELQNVDFAEIDSISGEVLKLEPPGLTQWSGHRSVQIVWLWWSNGNISCTNPDNFVIAKMVQIASRLNARLQGDEGEIYT